MNWSFLKRSNRHGSFKSFQGEELVQQKNFLTVEQEDQYDILNCLDNRFKKLYKEAKKYEELLEEVGKSEKRVTKNLGNSHICQEKEALRNIVEDWITFTSKISVADEQVITVIQQAWLEPLKKYQLLLIEIGNQIKKRENHMQECEKLKAKVKKMEAKEKTGSNIAKLNNAKIQLKAIQDEFQVLDGKLKEDIPLLYDLRDDYIQPCFDALMQAQVYHSGEMTNIFQSSQTHLDSFSSDYRAQQEKRIKSIQALSIVAMDK